MNCCSFTLPVEIFNRVFYFSAIFACCVLMHWPSSPINPVKGNIVFHRVCREKMEGRDSPEVRTSNGSKCFGLHCICEWEPSEPRRIRNGGVWG